MVMPSTYFDVVIREAQVFDGTGGRPFIADVAINDDRIAYVGEVSGAGNVELAARGLALAPGFIDVHSHDDAAVFVAPQMDFKVMQGVTTDVVGNCGIGAAPYPVARDVFRALHGNVELPIWDGYSGYFYALDRNPPSINIAVLAGHGTIRAAAMGNAQRAPDTREMDAMRSCLREALDAALSDSLPGSFTSQGAMLAQRK
jgi:N-acyl-D-amino-acid deacylase